MALNPAPAIALTKSAMLSFLPELLSLASIKAILSSLTSTVADVSSFKSNAKVLLAEISPPPLRPLPAVKVTLV